jgi:hypothetical protein
MARKTEQINLRIDPALKRKAAKAAAEDHRPLGSLVSHLLAQHCREREQPAEDRPSKRGGK